jgi:hypothetical protein
MSDKCLRCSGTCLINTEYAIGQSRIMAKISSKTVMGMIEEPQLRQLSLYICGDCGHSEFVLNKEHLASLKQYYGR